MPLKATRQSQTDRRRVDSGWKTKMDEDQRNGKASSRQYMWIVRYGLTYPPLEEGVGPYDS